MRPRGYIRGRGQIETYEPRGATGTESDLLMRDYGTSHHPTSAVPLTPFPPRRPPERARARPRARAQVVSKPVILEFHFIKPSETLRGKKRRKKIQARMTRRITGWKLRNDVEINSHA